MPGVNPYMLVLAREAEGFTLRELSERLSFGYSTLSRYESGLVAVPDAHLKEICSELRRPWTYFFRREKVYGASCMFHRKRSGIQVRELKRIHAHVNELRIQAVTLLRGTEIETETSFFRLSTKEFGTPEAIARELRRLWQLPPGPIRSVVEAIEDAGGLAFRCEFRNPRIDGVSQWPLDDDAAQPIFCVNEDIPGDRQRFTLSHEIGHVVMHHEPSTDHEVEANRFASEFLMPADEIAPELTNIDLVKATELKTAWKVSMAALIRRAFDLECISDRRYRYLNMQLAAQGFKRCEPIPLPAEEPELFAAVLDVYRSSQRRSDSEMSDLLGQFTEQFQTRHGYSQLGLRLIV